MLPRPRRIPGTPAARLAIAAAIVALAVWPGRPAISAPPGQNPTIQVSVSPASGPAGSSVSLSATGFFADDAASSGTVTFDGIQIDSHHFVRCTVTPGGPLLGEGFGKDCNGVAVMETVPGTALPGPHTFTVTDPFRHSGSATFTVTVPTATSTATPTVTSTATSAPTATPTSTPTITVTPTPTAGLPGGAPCTTPPTGVRALAPRQASGGSRYQGGDLVSLQASGLPASTSLLLLFDGPRWKLQGATATRIPFSAPLGIAMTDGSGYLQTTIRIPADAMYGTAQVKAFNRTSLRSGPLHVWSLDTGPHDPWLDVTGPPNTSFVLTAGRSIPAPDNSCSGSTGSGGGVRLTVNPGVNTVHLIGPGGSPSDHLVLGLPGEITGINLGNILGGPPPLSACASKLEFLGLFDNLSGNQFVENGFSPFGYFLHGVSVPEVVILTIGTKDGSPVPADCKPVLAAEMHDDSGPFSQDLGQFNPAPIKPDVDNYLASLFPRANALDEAWGTNDLVGKIIKEIFTAFTSSSINYLIPLDPGKFSPGFGRLGLTISGTPLISPAFQIVDPHWGSNQYHSDIGPSFDANSRTYFAGGTIPQQALDYSWPQDFGWSKHGIIPAFTYHLENSLHAGITTNESFGTDGTWHADDAAIAKAVVVNQTVVDQSVPLSASYNDPSPPGMQLDRQELGSGLHYNPSAPIVSFPIFGFTVPVVNIDIGFTADIYLNANLDAYLSGAINPDFSVNDLTITGEGNLSLTATGGLDLGVGGVGAGIQASLDLTVPVSYRPGSRPPISANPCLSGGINFVVHWWYDIWVASDSGNFINQPLASFSIPDGCSHSALQGAYLSTTMASALSLAQPVRHIHIRLQSATPASSTAPSISVDGRGRAAAVWVRRDAALRKDLLLAADGIGGAWSPATTITTSPAAILSPHVAELGNGRAVATWVQNTLTAKGAAALRGARAVDVLAAMLRHQEVFSATWNGKAWSKPHRLTHDLVLDNAPALAADQTHHTAMMVWTRGTDARHIGLVVSRFAHGAWGPIRSVPGTIGKSPRATSLTRQANRYALSWIGGSAANGTVRVFADRNGRWSRLKLSGFPKGAQETSIAPNGKGLAVAASVITTDSKGVPAIWTAVSSGTRWHAQQITQAGRHPALAARSGGSTILTYSKPEDPAFLGGTSQIADAVAPPNGLFSAPGLITGQSNSLQNPAVAVDPRDRSLLLLYQSLTPDGAPAVTSNPDWRLALKPSAKTLDSVAGVQAGSVDLQPHIVADLQAATLSDPHPAPGEQVTLSVPVYNVGLAAGNATGYILPKSGTAVLAPLPVNTGIAPNGVYSAKIAFAAPATPIDLSTQTLAAITGNELGLPLTPTAVVANPTTDGSVELSWSAPTDHDIVEYDIYRAAGSGTYELVGLAHATSFVDAAKTEGATGSLRYAVTAVDAQGRESQLSAPAPVTVSG